MMMMSKKIKRKRKKKGKGKKTKKKKRKKKRRKNKTKKRKKKKNKLKICFKKTALHHTSFKRYEVHSTSDFLNGGWEDLNQRHGPQEVKTSRQWASSESIDEIYLLLL
jgi:hypothetical protein